MKIKNLWVGLAVSLFMAPMAFAQDAPADTAPKADETPVKVPEHIHGDIVYGSPDAPVEIIEYASMTCPHCKTFNDTVLPYLKEELIPQGKVKLVFRNFVRDRADLAVAVMTRCAATQDDAKALIAIYFDQQSEWARSKQPGVAIQSIANLAGLSFERLNECSSSREIAEHLIDMRQMGDRLYKIEAIPTILINGTKVQFKSFDDLRDKIDLALIGK
jgi:protein-disulfide isomerase